VVRNHVFEVRWLGVDPTPTKTPQIVEAGMSADAHAATSRFRHNAMHGVWVASMKTTSDVLRSDDLQDAKIITDVVSAKNLPPYLRSD
jgi:hypothetical protein